MWMWKKQQKNVGTHSFSPLSSESKGFQLLSKMGYKEGMGLGKQGKGIAEPIPVVVRDERIGFGREEHEKEVLNIQTKANMVILDNIRALTEAKLEKIDWKSKVDQWVEMKKKGIQSGPNPLPPPHKKPKRQDAWHPYDQYQQDQYQELDISNPQATLPHPSKLPVLVKSVSPQQSSQEIPFPVASKEEAWRETLATGLDSLLPGDSDMWTTDQMDFWLQIKASALEKKFPVEKLQQINEILANATIAAKLTHLIHTEQLDKLPLESKMAICLLGQTVKKCDNVEKVSSTPPVEEIQKDAKNKIGILDVINDIEPQKRTELFSELNSVLTDSIEAWKNTSYITSCNATQILKKDWNKLEERERKKEVKEDVVEYARKLYTAALKKQTLVEIEAKIIFLGRHPNYIEQLSTQCQEILKELMDRINQLNSKSQTTTSSDIQKSPAKMVQNVAEVSVDMEISDGETERQEARGQSRDRYDIYNQPPTQSSYSHTSQPLRSETQPHMSSTMNPSPGTSREVTREDETTDLLHELLESLVGNVGSQTDIKDQILRTLVEQLGADQRKMDSNRTIISKLIGKFSDGSETAEHVAAPARTPSESHRSGVDISNPASGSRRDDFFPTEVVPVEPDRLRHTADQLLEQALAGNEGVFTNIGQTPTSLQSSYQSFPEGVFSSATSQQYGRPSLTMEEQRHNQLLRLEQEIRETESSLRR